MARVKLQRDAGDVSPKVAVPAVLIAVAAVITAVVSGGWNAPETSTAIAALITLVTGYFTSDKVDVAAAVESE